MIKDIEHISVVTKDLDASLKFYTELLGFELVGRERVEAQQIEVAFLRVGGSLFELVHFTDNREYNYTDGLFEVVALRVDDIFAAAETLKSRGVEMLMDKPFEINPGDYFMFFRGPSGEKLEIIQKNKA
jgi:catechol 2,3-dioxygenase-like lactoylglutathione lyase family enzyme